jgi:N-acyl-D-amino-acid deacylase
VVFDADALRDTATYENPRSYPEGVSFVAVNGTLVVDEAQPTGATPGRALRKPYGRKPERVEGDSSGLGQ